ncbi:MAG: outer membrane protein assembly factor BamD [Bacteroidetes bacterium]|nr:outer membrane protein assembly factor BamD [Bacteroidota bacterium]MCL1967952.1 outer membrane protein assembly factor BamD [Bacteroidota bacterium]
MKKIGKIDFNLLILLILCLTFGDASAATKGVLLQKNNRIDFFDVCEATLATPPIDIKNKKKKQKTTTNKSKGKVNFESFRQYYNKALGYYDKKAYLSAARIFEELYPLSIGTPVGDTILFLFADSYYQNRDYQMAAFHFKDYTRRYPGTERTELAALNAVKSMYYNSPDYNLDQFVTLLAIDEINLFIQQYPHSKYIEECNSILDEMRNKLARKELEIVKMYYDIGYYEATQIAAKNFLKTYSASVYAPETLYILIKNNYDYARKSVENKKYNRYRDCLDACETLQMRYPESSFLPEIKKIAAEAEIQIKKLETQNK